MDVVLYNSMCVSMFLISRQIANFVVSFVIILGTVMYLDQSARCRCRVGQAWNRCLNPPKAEAGTEASVSGVAVSSSESELSEPATVTSSSQGQRGDMP